MKNKINLVIFDVDGVILDSEPLHYNAKVEILRSYGLNETFDLKEYIGKPNKDLWSKIIKENHLDIEPGDLEMQQFNLILKYIENDHITPTKGLVELLTTLKKLNICLAIASSSNRYYVNHILNYLGLNQYFAHTVTGDEVSFQKPYPDIYKKILSISGIPACNAVAIEDSTSGVQAAVSAGIKCLGYQNLSSGMQNLSLADYTINEIGQAVGYIVQEK